MNAKKRIAIAIWVSFAVIMLVGIAAADDGSGEGKDGHRRPAEEAASATITTTVSPKITVSPRITVSPSVTSEQSQGQSQVGIVSTTITDKNNQEVTFISPKQAPGATAPGLSVSNGTCMGSSSAGLSGPWGGVSVGSSWKDEDCNIRYFAGMAEGMSLHEVALTILSQNEMFAQALRLNKVRFVPYEDTVIAARVTGGFVDPAVEVSE